MSIHGSIEASVDKAQQLGGTMMYSRSGRRTRSVNVRSSLVLLRAGVGCLVLPGGNLAQYRWAAFGQPFVCVELSAKLPRRQDGHVETISPMRLLLIVIVSHDVV